MFNNSSDKLIIALDGMNKAEAISFTSNLPELKWVKVGLELFVSEGPSIINEFKQSGLNVFLDLKFHDIPITMSRACYQAGKTGADLITVHACAGKNAIKDSVTSSREGAFASGFSPPTLLAVTVLTSWETNALSQELFINQSIEQRVRLLAALSKEAGVGGCVCSPLEVHSLRTLFPHPFELVTPGIRNKENEIDDDQERVMSASEAINAGASRIVVGRPITKSDDPIGKFKLFCDQLEEIT